MKISVLIPTFNNLPYLKLCINSLEKYSFFNNHEIIVHVNDGSDGTLNFIKEKNIVLMLLESVPAIAILK